MECPPNGHTAHEFPGICKLLPQVHKGIRRQGVPNAAISAQQRKKFECNERAQEVFENIKRKVCEAPVLGMPREEGIYVLDTDVSVVAISGILHQEQEWNGRKVLRPLAYDSKVISDTEMKHGVANKTWCHFSVANHFTVICKGTENFSPIPFLLLMQYS